MKKLGIGIGALLVVATIAFIYMTPRERTPGVRLGGSETSAPADWSSVNDETLMRLKPGGFPPFVINIWYVGTEDGIITATRPDGGYWGKRVKANTNGRVRIGDAAYTVQASLIADSTERRRLLASYVDKYNLQNVPGMTLEDLDDPDLPWEVFFWTAR